ncbi:MAG: hypothetical protein ACOX18_06635 [Bacillota bacterium]
MFRKAVVLLTGLFLLLAFCSPTLAYKDSPTEVVLSAALASAGPKSFSDQLFGGDVYALRGKIDPKNSVFRGEIVSARGNYSFEVSGELNAFLKNEQLLYGTMLGHIETQMGVKDAALRVEISPGGKTCVLVVDGMGASYLAFGDIYDNYYSRQFIDYFKDVATSVCGTANVGPVSPQNGAPQEPIEIMDLGSDPNSHREHYSTELFSQINGVSTDACTGIINLYSYPPNYLGNARGLLQVRIWTRPEEVKTWLNSDYIALSQVQVDARLRNESLTRADGQIWLFNPQPTTSILESVSVDLMIGLMSLDPELERAGVILGLARGIALSSSNVTVRNWDGNYGNDEILWRIGGADVQSIAFPATLTSEQSLRNSYAYPEGGMPFTLGWDALHHESTAWIHCVAGRIVYEYLTWDSKLNDWVIVPAYTEVIPISFYETWKP